MAVVTNRSNVDSTSTGTDERDDEAAVPLGTFLYEALPDSDIDSVESVRELRERE
ncbi:hypothetical protein U3A55_07995 [Salarchaeum sp. III]|uniref:hypothetical protein n=1 Tax=Salarchaeum sp. III TaxID=3107927 RepID=UPI002EDB957A